MVLKLNSQGKRKENREDQSRREDGLSEGKHRESLGKAKQVAKNNVLGWVSCVSRGTNQFK